LTLSSPALSPSSYAHKWLHKAARKTKVQQVLVLVVLVEKEGNKRVIHGHSNKGRIYEIKMRRERL
jgi:uncharacterized protein GlcG (DUF336 family)